MTIPRARRPPRRASRTDQLLGLVDLAYQASTDGSLWTDYLAAAARSSASDCASIIHHDHRAGSERTLVSWGKEAGLIAEYEDWVDRNPIRKAAAPAVGSLVPTEQLYPASELVRTDFFHGYMKRIGMLHTVTSIALVDEGGHVELALGRDIGRDPYGAADLDVLAEGMRHLGRALRVGRILDQAPLMREAAHHALDHLEAGVAVLDAAGRVILTNQRFEEIRSQQDGLDLDPSGALSCARSADTARLLGLIAVACAMGGEPRAERLVLRGSAGRTGPEGCLQVARPSHRRPYSVTVSPLRLAERRATTEPAAAILCVVEPDRAQPGVDTALRTMFTLTRMEATVAARLVEGESLAVIATALGISRNTARVHLRHVLVKTGTHRQAELVRVLLGAIGGVGRIAPAEAPRPAATPSERAQQERAVSDPAPPRGGRSKTNSVPPPGTGWPPRVPPSIVAKRREM